MVAMRAGEYRAAKNHTLQASEIFERVLDVRYTGGCFAMLGLIEFTLGEMQEAILVQTRAIEIADRIRDEYLKAVTLHNLGNTLASQGQYENALASMKQSEQIYRTVGTTALVIGSQAQAGLFLALLGRWVEARGTLEHVTRVAAAEGMSRELGWANVGLAVLARRQGQLQDAVRFGRLALEPAMRWNDAHDRADAAIVLADTLIEQGALDEAEENYRAALALREQMQQTHLYPEAFVGLAHAAMQRGETETARAWMEKAWNGESLRLLPGPKEPFWIYWTGYQVMRALGDPRAERLVETAQMVFAEYVSQISDLETRDQYLLVPWHRAILKATHASPSLPFFVFSDAAALRAQ
jgi:tetratricopeptide (TPR) repeat protein